MEERKNCNKIKDGNGRLALKEGEVRRIWKGYFEDLYNIDTQDQVTTLKNEKAAGKDEVTGEMIKFVGDSVMD